MKEETRKKIVDYITYRCKFFGGKIPQDYLEEDISVLFDMYAECELKSFLDFNRSHYDFIQLIREYGCCFDAEKHAASSFAYRKARWLDLYGDPNYKAYRPYQNIFADEVADVVSRDTGVKILEVGSGPIPYAALKLSNAGYDVSCIDSDTNLASSILRRLNLKSYRSLFNEQTAVSKYGVVVGRRPCSAIPHIVRNCKKEQVPYFIKLCACELSSKKVEDWKPILKSLDSDVKFYSDYAYNGNYAAFDFPNRDVIEEIISRDNDVM